MTGNLGLIVALDMPSFYCFFALMSFASVLMGLVGGIGLFTLLVKYPRWVSDL